MKLKKLAAIGFGVGFVSFLAMACKSDEPAQQGGYPQQPQPAPVGQAPQQPGYGQPAATVPATGAVPAATTAAAPAGLSTPGPLALPCTTDANCGTAHCNTQFGKCVFPCVTDTDCIAPNHCIATLCVPALPGQ